MAEVDSQAGDDSLDNPRSGATEQPTGKAAASSSSLKPTKDEVALRDEDLQPVDSRVLDPQEQRLVVAIEARLESRLVRVLRRETRDPYGGLPADDVLQRLHERFPNENFPARMLARLENEQAARHDREKRLDELEMYVAETSRIDAAADRDLRNRTSNRALLVTILLVAVGLVLEFTGHEAGGNIVLGTTLVGVVGAFLANQIRASR